MDLDLDDVIVSGTVLATCPENTFPEALVFRKSYCDWGVEGSQYFKSGLDEKINQYVLQPHTRMSKPERLTKWSVLSVLSGSFSAGLYALLPAITSVALAVGIIGAVVGSVVTTACIVSFVKEIFKENLDKESTRLKVQNRLMTASFAEVSRKYTFETLIGYDLLAKRIKTQSNLGKLEYYSKISTLYDNKVAIENCSKDDRNRADEIYINGTRAFTNWYLLSLSSLTALANSKKKYFYDKNSETTLRDIANSSVRIAVVNKYQHLMKPWNEWKQLELSSIKEGINSAMTGLDLCYRELSF